MSKPYKVTKRYNETPIKIPMVFFTETKNKLENLYSSIKDFT